VFANNVMINKTKGRNGGYIGTLNGRKFFPIDPHPEDVYKEDIAHALSRKQRWNTFTSQPHTVGKHTLHGLRIARTMPLPEKDEHMRESIVKYFFLHDATEAYLPDVPTPVKPFFKGWFDIEFGVAKSIWSRFGLDIIPYDINKYVKQIDHWSLNMESDVLVDKLDNTIYGYRPADAIYDSNPVDLQSDNVEIKRLILEEFDRLFPEYAEPSND